MTFYVHVQKDAQTKGAAALSAAITLPEAAEGQPNGAKCQDSERNN
jgi:hypothetical protein